jgi:iron(III) transport system ATP-binding protein
VAIRPEAWHIRAANHSGLPARLLKSTYLGSVMEYTFATSIGEIFMVSSDVQDRLVPGAAVSLQLGHHGVSVVEAA